MTMKLGSLKIFDATVLASTEASAVIYMEGYVPVKIFVEGAMVGTEISFEVGADPAALQPLYDIDGLPVKVTLDASDVGAYSVYPAYFTGCPYVQLVSNGNETSNVSVKIYGYKI